MTSSLMYQILDIVKGTTVDGPGLRTSIYFAGCSHHCKGCQNPQSWDPANGYPMSLDELMQVIEEEDFDVTLSGGDPLLEPEKMSLLIKDIKKNGRNIWIYTGYVWEEIVENELLLNAIKEADVLVDGRFIENLRDTDLRFRGSSNQRVIDIPKSLKMGGISLISFD